METFCNCHVWGVVLPPRRSRGLSRPRSRRVKSGMPVTFPARRQSYDSSSRQAKEGAAKQQLGALCSCYRSAPTAYLCLTKSERH